LLILTKNSLSNPSQTGYVISIILHVLRAAVLTIRY